ncbi:hypothetical protein ANN_19465 [Periplaneta americana]|uniref:Uncharacterized protein n=1 Tax=Periplaneta americana TaxID=6978 RepID=A0ABQ8S9Z4_PERAM|nr:hypothetical protein ANN_19465 [Periplaneta americana]
MKPQNSSEPFLNFCRLLAFTVLKRNGVYVLSKEEVPHATSSDVTYFRMAKGSTFESYVKVNDIENDPAVRDIDIKRRSCRFADENFLDIYPVYSPSACEVNCRLKLQMKLCNCTNFFMPGVDKEYHCDIYGLLCLRSHVVELSTRKESLSSKRIGFYCKCEEGCTTKIIAFVRFLREIRSKKETGITRLKLKMNNLPSELFKRSVVRGKLDLVVSMGGAAGLFVGASLLSFVELIYFFTIRLFVNIRRGSGRQSQDDLLSRAFLAQCATEIQNCLNIAASIYGLSRFKKFNLNASQNSSTLSLLRSLEAIRGRPLRGSFCMFMSPSSECFAHFLTLLAPMHTSPYAR